MNECFTSFWNVVVRRVNSSGSLIWTTCFPIYEDPKSFSIDASEQNVYFIGYSNPISVVRLSAINGVLANQLTFNGVSGVSTDMKIFPFADSSGYIFNGFDSSAPNYAKLCKYTFSTSSAQCQTMTGVNTGYGAIMLSSTQYFIFGAETISPYSFHMHKITFSNTSVDWANKIVCSSGTCNSAGSDSQLSLDGLTIYSFFIFGSTKYLYFAAMSALTGSVTADRFKSSISITYITGSALYGDYAIASTNTPSLLIYKISSASFIVKLSSMNNHYSCAVESTSGRFILNGVMPSGGKTVKFIPQAISQNSEFSTGTFEMYLIPYGTDEILPQSGVTITLPTSVTIGSSSLVNQSAPYVSNSKTTLDIYYQIVTQSFTFIETNITTFTPDLSCSFSGSTSINYSISNYGSSMAPTFVSIGSNSGTLTITEPSVDADTEFDFYINSINIGLTSPAQKLIKLNIINCLVDNCRFCSSSNTSACIACNSGYDLYLDSCVSHISKTYFPTEIIVEITIAVIVVTNLISLSSIESLWSIINQMQMLFLILLTGVFIPLDVKIIIQGPSFAINIYSYIPLSSTQYDSSVFSKYNFPSTSPMLQDVGVSTDSSIYNIHVMLICILLIILIHVCLYFVMKRISRIHESRGCKLFLKIIKWAIAKLYRMLTFGFYIRNLLQMALYIMLSTIYEISIFNTEDVYFITSLLFAIFIMLFYLVFIVITLCIICSSYKIDEDNHNKLGELFVGLKPHKKSRFHIAAIMIRRCIYAVILLTLVSTLGNKIIYTLTSIQFCFAIYTAFLRPYKKMKANIIETLNEVYFFVCLLCLVFLNKKEDWSSFKISLYVWMIVSNSIIVLLIIMIYLIWNFIQWIRKKLKYTKISSSNSNTKEEMLKTLPHPSILMTNKTINKESQNDEGNDECKSRKEISHMDIMNGTKQLKEESKYGPPIYLENLES